MLSAKKLIYKIIGKLEVCSLTRISSDTAVSLSTTNKIVSCDHVYVESGNLTQTTTGGVRCVTSGTVEVSGTVTLSGLNSTDVVAALVSGSSGGSYVHESSSFYAYGTSAANIAVYHVTPVSAGEIIFLRARNATAARGNAVGAKLTVRYL